jgi:hypothetical protein
LELLPANPVVEVTRAMRPTVTFRAVGRQRDGRTRELTGGVRFTLDDRRLGALTDASGVFTPSGVGGQTAVRVSTVDGSALNAQTTLTVNARGTFEGPGVDAMARMRLDDVTPTGAAMMAPSVDYPLEGAVMPVNVYAPNVQWSPRQPMAGVGDLYRVRLTRPHAVLEAYLVHGMGFTHAWQPPQEAWALFAQSDVGQPIEVRVRVLSRGTVFESARASFRTVDGVTAGSVYYWNPARGRLVRLDVDRAQRVDFMPNPGAPCIGCHTVSRSGQRLGGFLEGGGAEDLALYDLTRDLTPNPAPTVARQRYPLRRCASFNGDATRLVAGDCGANASTTRFQLIDARSGMEVPGTAGMAGDGFDPEWSPNSQLIAYTDRMNSLAVTPVLPGDRFGPSRVLHPAGSSPDGNMDWHPTFSPDSRWLAYQHGETRRTAVATGGGTRGALWFLGADGGTPVRLDRANGGAMVFDSYRPVFSPFNSGGYFWLLFTTTRPYGNMFAGTRGAKQIWVTAINNHPDGRRDPSEVAYWLPGQENVTGLSPYWTPPPCRPTGRGCSTDDDCCSGECAMNPDGSTTQVCVPNTGMCRPRGRRCSGGSDCCEGLVCTDARLCDLPNPG